MTSVALRTAAVRAVRAAVLSDAVPALPAGRWLVARSPQSLAVAAPASAPDLALLASKAHSRLFVAERDHGTRVLPLAAAAEADDDGERVRCDTTPSAAWLELRNTPTVVRDIAARIAHAVELDAEPRTVADAGSAYAALASGDAALYVQLPNVEDVEKDATQDATDAHVIGALVVQEAGGAVSDVFGEPLASARAVGVVASASGALHARVLAALQSERDALREPKEPLEPQPGECCGNGCYPCVWELHDTAVREFNELHAKYIATKLALTGIAPPRKKGEHRPGFWWLSLTAPRQSCQSNRCSQQQSTLLPLSKRHSRKNETARA